MMFHKKTSRNKKPSVTIVLYVYKSIWTPVIGEELVVAIENDNKHD